MSYSVKQKAIQFKLSRVQEDLPVLEQSMAKVEAEVDD